jgi:3-hydroxybutyryl-CoA dehydrogenase
MAAAFEVLVLGNGVMGRGIAATFAAGGMATAVVSRSASATAAGAMPPGVTLLEALPDAAPALVIESVIEDIPAKHAAYARIEAKYAGSPVIATNTSALDIELLAAPLAFPQRFVAAHWYMPADAMPQVEIAPGARTDPAAYALVKTYLERSGKQVLALKRAVPGLLNRIQHAMMHEAYYMIAEGICSAEEIDSFCRTSFGPRMCIGGLIQQKDISGLDVNAMSQRAIVPHLCHSAEPQRPVQDLYEAGHLGIKTGKGFYDWTGQDAASVKREHAEKLRKLTDFLDRL